MNETKDRSFRGLLVWRQAMELTRDCYLLTRRLPREELYGLTSQIRRAATSIPANIAEGNGRATRKDYGHFLRVAQGSLRELETYLLLLPRIGAIESRMTEPLLRQLDSVARLLNRLIHAVEAKGGRLGP